MSAWLKKNWLITLVLTIAFLLRFIPLFEYEFFFDELTAIDRIRYTNLADIINKGVKPDVHPLFIQVFLFYWSKIGGTSEVWIKLPFLMCGFLSCWFVFRLAANWFDYKTGVIAAIVISCSMIFLVYSSSNHLYATAVLFSILSTHYLFKIVFGESIRFKDYFLFGLFILLGAYNHHMGALFGLISGVLGLVFSTKKQKILLLVTALGTLIFYLPNLPITLTQMSYSIGADQGGWLTPPKWYACFSFLKTLFGTGLVIYFVLLLFVFSSIRNRFSFLADKKIVFLLMAFIIYCLGVYFYSILKNPILQFSVLLIGSPCILIVVARGISFIPNKAFTIACVALILCFLIQTIFIKRYYSIGIKQSNRSAVVQTIEAKKKYGAANVTAIYITEPFFVKHYLDEFRQNYSYLTAFDSTTNNQVLLSRYLKSLKENYIILSDPDAILLQKVKCYFPYVLYHDEGYFKSVFLLSKVSTNSIKDETIVGVYSMGSSFKPFRFTKPYKKERDFILADSTEEFPFSTSADFDSLHLALGQAVVCSAVFKPYKNIGNLMFVFAIRKNDSCLFFTGSNFKDFYVPEDNLQYGFSNIFIGTEIDACKKSNLDANFWNTDKKRYWIKDVTLKVLDCNPHKHSVWD